MKEAVSNLTWKTAYRGYGFSCLGLMAHRVTNTVFLKYAQAKFNSDSNHSPAQKRFRKFVIGTSADVLAGLLFYPLQTVLRKFILSPEGKYESATDCMNKTIEEDGLGSLYEGVLFKISIGVAIGCLAFLYESFTTDDQAEATTTEKKSN